MGSFYKAVNESQTLTAPSDKSITGFWWKHTPSKGLDNIDLASLYLWNNGKVVGGKSLSDGVTLFSSLTRNERLKLIEDHLKDCYLGIAKQQNIDNTINTARTTVLAENETKFELTNGV